MCISGERERDARGDTRRGRPLPSAHPGLRQPHCTAHEGR